MDIYAAKWAKRYRTYTFKYHNLKAICECNQHGNKLKISIENVIFHELLSETNSHSAEILRILR